MKLSHPFVAPFLACLFLLFGMLAGAPPGLAAEAEPPDTLVSVDLRGALALVEMTRFITPSSVNLLSRTETVSDFALPDRAQVVDIHVGSRLVPHEPLGQARSNYLAARQGRGLSGAVPVAADNVDLRLRLLGFEQAIAVRVRLLVPLSCVGGALQVQFPPMMEGSAGLISWRVRSDNPRRLTIDGLVPSTNRAGWWTGQSRAAASWTISQLAGAGTTQPLLAGNWQEADRGRLTVAICRPQPLRPPVVPEEILLVIDRSRSVGSDGLSAEREWAHALLEQLPPVTRFNAVLFDRRATLLFATAREATREALAALDQALTPGHLGNGTSLREALALASQRLPVPAWWFLLTDGALPEGERGVPWTAPEKARVAVLVVRPEGDEPPEPEAASWLAALAARSRGLLRAITPRGVADSAAAVVQGFGDRQGDFVDLRVDWSAPGPGTRRGREAGQGPFPSQGGTLPAGQGAQWHFDLARYPQTVRLRAMTGGKVWTHGLRPRRLPSGWDRPAAGTAAYWGGEEGALLAEWRGDEGQEAVPVVRGDMDRGILRNALSLGFLPRARGCYLRRPAHSAADRDLRGRVTLELALSRGEVTGATIAASTLHRPAIETCLVEAAFALDLPRPMHRDAPVLARLNLVFAPLTPAAGEAGEGHEVQLGREIDILLGPVVPVPGVQELLAPPP